MGAARIITRVHELKTWPPFFQAIVDGEKSFELRKDDRGFEVGDILVLKEFDPHKGCGEYTWRDTTRVVIYKLAGGQFSGIEKDYCILGLGVLPPTMRVVEIDNEHTTEQSKPYTIQQVHALMHGGGPCPYCGALSQV
jgi:hypothetical protein